MKKGLLLAVFWVFCLAAFSQNQPHLSFAEKEDLLDEVAKFEKV